MAVLQTEADERHDWNTDPGPVPSSGQFGPMHFGQRSRRSSRPRCGRLRLALPLLCLIAEPLAGCAQQSCANPYVLDFLSAEDARATLAHRGLVRDAVRSDPGPTPDTARCAIWEQVSNPAYGATPHEPPTLLRPQYYSVTRIDDGWRLTP